MNPAFVIIHSCTLMQKKNDEAGINFNIKT